jgi:heat shock protein HslJ
VSFRALGILTLLPLVLVACADSGSSAGGGSTNPADLEGGVWALDQSSMSSLTEEVPPGASVTLEFSQGQVHGTSACNSYSGGYQATDDGALSFDQLAGTMMACDAPLMALEREYLQALDRVTEFSIDSTLVLTGDSVPLTFAAQPAPEALSLVGTAWQVSSIAQDSAVQSVLADTELTAKFSDAGEIHGSAGCNTYGGTYTTSGDTMSFSALATTRMMCAEDVMAQETVFLAAMEQVASYEIEGTQLRLLDADGAMLLGFDGA